MWENIEKSVLVESIARAQRLETLLSSPVGDDIRAVIKEVAEKWLVMVKKGDPHAHAGLVALDDVATAFDLVINIGHGMRLELIRRYGGNDATGYAETRAAVNA